MDSTIFTNYRIFSKTVDKKKTKFPKTLPSARDTPDIFSAYLIILAKTIIILQRRKRTVINIYKTEKKRQVLNENRLLLREKKKQEKKNATNITHMHAVSNLCIIFFIQTIEK